MSEFKINFSNQAKEQLKLMLENDFSLEGSGFRLQISGKKCEGFLYEVGFDAKKVNDLVIEFPDFHFFMQPFTAKFCKNISIDYLFDPETGAEGFMVENHDQNKYQGKFFKNLEGDLFS